MPPISQRNLHWVHRNRQFQDRTVDIGSLARQIVAGRVQPSGQRVAAIQRLLAEHVDDEFTAHCTLGPLTGGTLTILVDDPAYAYPLCQRWLVPLLDQFRTIRSQARITSLKFTPGKSELPVVPEVPK